MAYKYTTHEALSEIVDVHVEQATLIRIEQATRCAVCKTPPGRLDAPFAARREWALRFGARLGDRFAGRRPSVDRAPEPLPVLDYEQITELVHDSQLQPVVGLPEDVVAPLLNGLPDDELDALTNELVFAMCDRCAYSSTIDYETSAAIRERYIDERLGGDAAALAALDSSGAIRRLFQRIDDVMLRRAS